MWNYRDWFRFRKIPHVFSIRSSDSRIYGVRFKTHQDIGGDYAILSESPENSEYRTVLSYGDDRIFFRELSPFSVMNEISTMNAVVSDWEEKLMRTVLTHGSLTDLLDAGDPIFHCPVIVTFCDQVLSVSTSYESTGRLLWKHFTDLSLTDLLRIMPADSPAYNLYASSHPVVINSPVYKGKQCLISNLTSAGGKCIRITAFANEFSFSPGSLHFMKHLTNIIRTYIDGRDSLYASRHVDTTAFFIKCRNGQSLNETEALQVLHRLGWHMDDKYSVFKIALKQPSNTLAMDKLFQVLESIPSSIRVRFDRDVSLVCNTSFTEADELCASILKIISSRLFIVSQSNISADFLSLPQLFLQTEEAFSHAVRSGVPFLSFPDIMSEYTLKRIHEHICVQAVIHPAVNMLLCEDRRNNTQYAVSLYEWLRLGCNYNAAAKKLDLHRNTLVSRLDRISFMTGLDLQDQKTQESLILSFLISGISTDNTYQS